MNTERERQKYRLVHAGVWLIENKANLWKHRFMVKEDELETRSKDREEEDQYTHRQRIRENTERGEQRNRDYRNNKKGLY